MDYDVFISHASEDKDGFVRDLAKKLEEQHLMVWYDEFTLKPGSSLRRSIDFGLANCRFGILVLSEHFFDKNWTNWELDGLVARQNAYEQSLLIPIWLNVDRDKVLNYSPPLADKVAVNANIGIDDVVARLLTVVKPEGSTLVVARDYLCNYFENPPNVTDDWWLDIVGYSGQEYINHEYLSFKIPFESWEPKNRGIFIARHALQKLWQNEGDKRYLSQLTCPEEVLNFIESQPGLKEVALKQPQNVAFYFPQLAIRGFGGYLESAFEELLNKYVDNQSKYLCRSVVALRHPEFGNNGNIKLAAIYFSGDSGGIGPSTNRHEYIDCIIWLLSSESVWLPSKIRHTLLEGLKQWAVWEWSCYSSNSYYEKTQNSGALERAMQKAKVPGRFVLTKRASLDLKERIGFGKKRLNLSETVQELYDKFFDEKIIETWIKQKK